MRPDSEIHCAALSSRLRAEAAFPGPRAEVRLLQDGAGLSQHLTHLAACKTGEGKNQAALRVICGPTALRVGVGQDQESGECCKFVLAYLIAKKESTVERLDEKLTLWRPLGTP